MARAPPQPDCRWRSTVGATGRSDSLHRRPRGPFRSELYPSVRGGRQGVRGRRADADVVSRTSDRRPPGLGGDGQRMECRGDASCGRAPAGSRGMVRLCRRAFEPLGRMIGRASESLRSRSYGKRWAAGGSVPVVSDRPMRLERSEWLGVGAIGLMALAIRLVKITQPFVDSWSFKQGTVAMMAE